MLIESQPENQTLKHLKSRLFGIQNSNGDLLKMAPIFSLVFEPWEKMVAILSKTIPNQDKQFCFWVIWPFEYQTKSLNLDAIWNPVYSMIRHV